MDSIIVPARRRRHSGSSDSSTTALKSIGPNKLAAIIPPHAPNRHLENVQPRGGDRKVLHIVQIVRANEMRVQMRAEKCKQR